jgi:nitrate reductase NapD
MNISGVIVHSKPENLSGVQQRLTALPGVEVHAAGGDGRMVVTVEETSDRKMADTVSGLQDIEGVIATSMVYHHFEDLENDNELNQQEVSQ